MVTVRKTRSLEIQFERDFQKNSLMRAHPVILPAPAREGWHPQKALHILLIHGDPSSTGTGRMCKAVSW